jgi:hypothetical protein
MVSEMNEWMLSESDAGRASTAEVEVDGSLVASMFTGWFRIEDLRSRVKGFGFRM